jgi:putative aldouronate transport system substrate-binding protein
MNRKKVVKGLSLALAGVMTAGLTAGCGSSGTGNNASSAAAVSDTAVSAASDASAAASSSESADAGTGKQLPVSHDEELTLDVYDVSANYQGEQTGWFGKILKDKFNLKLNIIAPQVAGDAVYQTRASSGNLGDLLLLENSSFKDCLSAGLVKDISADIYNYPNLAEFQEQIDKFNQGLDGNSGQIYGIPTQMTNTSPLTYSQSVIYSLPLLRWDQYKEVGSPDIKDLDGLLDVLEQIHDKYPTNDAGDACYPFTLWADWDGGDNMVGIANVVQLTTWYDEKIKGSAILKNDGTFTKLTDKNASYYKILKFLNDAYQRGLVDPDSGTQDWNSVSAKISAGQVQLLWYTWQRGFWNTSDRLKQGVGYVFVPVDDQVYYSPSDDYYGSGRVWAVGSGVDDEKYARIMEFLDWYSSPEGLTYQYDGLKDFNYTVNDDGTYTLINDNALMDNLPVPEEYGGGGYSDGNNQLNQWIVGDVCTNPNTGEPYKNEMWKSWIDSVKPGTNEEWIERFGADNPTDWMEKNGVLDVSPNVSVALESDSADMSVIRNQVNQSVCDYSWKMIFAKDDDAFNALWDEMTEQITGFDYDQLYDFDCKNYQKEVDAKNEIKAEKESK